MASHSGAVTVDVAPADSAVSVVGTGVELGARPDAIFAIVDSMVLCSGIFLALGDGMSRRECWKSRHRTEARFADRRFGQRPPRFGNLHLRHATCRMHTVALVASFRS
jgi:hypothetical protein